MTHTTIIASLGGVTGGLVLAAFLPQFPLALASFTFVVLVALLQWQRRAEAAPQKVNVIPMVRRASRKSLPRRKQS